MKKQLWTVLMAMAAFSIFVDKAIASAGEPSDESSSRCVVFIHGINSDPGCWTKMSKLFLEEGIVTSNNMKIVDYSGDTSLIGGSSFLWQYVDALGLGYNAPLNFVAEKVALSIKDFRAKIGNPKVNFVVHSMGGLIVRKMVMEGYFQESDIDKVVTLATPHYGQDNITLATQTREMHYGSSFMWNLANAEINIDPSKVYCLVGTQDFTVDYWAASLNGCFTQYVPKCHIDHLWLSGICSCEDGINDIVFRLVKGYLVDGVKGVTTTSPPADNKGAMLLQVVDGKKKPVEYTTRSIVTCAKSDEFEYSTGVIPSISGIGLLRNESYDNAYSEGIVGVFRDGSGGLFYDAVIEAFKRYPHPLAKAAAFTPAVLRQILGPGRSLEDTVDGMKPGEYKLTVADSKDGVFKSFITDGTIKVENGKTTVAQIPAENTKPVDFMFLIDSTGSMSGSINSVKNNAKRLIEEKLSGGARDCRVAVADYRDYPMSPYGDSGDYVFKLRCGFTTNAVEAIAALNGIYAGGGADTPEAVYSALANAIGMDWRKDAVKTIMLMCDAGPHDPEPWEPYYTRADIIEMAKKLKVDDDDTESGIDETYAKTTTLRSRRLLAASSGESGIFGGISIYPVLTSSSSSLRATFAPLAEETEGVVVDSGSYDSVASAVAKVIEHSVAATGFEFETVTVQETAGGVTLRVFGGNETSTASIGYQIVSGTALEGIDFSLPSGELKLGWSECERSYREIYIPVMADSVSADDKFFSVILYDPINMGLGGINVCRINVTNVYSTAVPESFDVFVQGLSRQPTMGSVSGSGKYSAGDTVTLVAEPEEGYVFTSWENGSMESVRDITIDDALEVASDGVATYIASFMPLEDLPIPEIKSGTSVVMTVGESGYWELKYESLSEAEVECEGLPDWLEFDGTAISGEPPMVGKFDLTFTVRNAKGETSSTVEFSFMHPAQEYENDDWADAIEIEGCEGSVAGSNVGATLEMGEPESSGNSGTVWWKWTAPENGMYKFTTDGSDFDTVLEVYVGDELGNLELVVSDDDANENLTSAVVFSAEAGVKYSIAVGGYESGAIALSWRQVDELDNLPDGCNVSEVDGRKWIWRYYDDGVELTGYYVSSWDENGEWQGGAYCGVYPAPEGVIEIPSEIEGVSVVRIGDYLLYGCEDIVSVSIPGSVKSIGYMAFAYSGVESVSVPAGVEVLGTYVFYGCYSLSEVSLPSTVEYIGNGAFAYCPSLATIRVASGNERYGVRGGVLYDDASHAAIVAESDVTKAVVEDGTLGIAADAFANCAALAEVDIPASVQSIGSYAFPEDADAIYDTASVPGVRVIDGWAMGPDWTVAYESLELGNIRGIAASAFPGLEVKSLEIPRTCEWICESAFYDCASLDSVKIPSGVKAIEAWAFEDCVSLANVTFEGDMLDIDMNINEAFAGTPWLANFAPKTPENDKFAQAVELAGTSGSVKGASYGATVEDGEPLADVYGSTASVWWHWEAPADGKVIMDTFGSSFDTVLGVYTGADVAALETVAECDDAESVDDNTSEAEFEATAGTAYYIAVAGYRAHTGRVILNWTYDPPLRLANVPVAIDSALVDGIDIDSLVFVVGRAYGADLERLTREIESSVARHGVAFAGWVNGDGSAITPATIVKDGDTLTARWEKFNPLAADDDAVDASAAQVYNGYALDADGNVAGTILVKVGKPNAKTGLASVSATLQMVGEKKIAFKASEKGKARLEGDGNATHGVTLVNAKAADDIVLETISENGIHGAYGEYEIVCARNRSKKDAGAYSKWVRTVEVALATKEATGAGADMAGGYSGVSVAIGAKGKVKVTGTMADGAKVSATGQLLVAEDGREACVNVFVPMYSGKKGGVAFLLWLGEGGSVEIESLGEWVCMDRKGAFTAGLELVDAATLAAPSGQKAFSVAGIPASVGGTTVHEKYLPVSVAVTAQGGRLAVAKANKVKLDKATGLPISTGGTDNDCALKLTYAAKNGTIKGSFVVWMQSGVKLKKIKATVAGIVVRGKGYGSAIIKNVGSFPVTLD